MSGVELKANDIGAAPAIKRRPVLPSVRVLPVLLTAIVGCAAAALGWGAWQYYMGTPWTRDATVRAYVVQVAPQVAGEIVNLPVADNQFVRKGDLLMLIDPRNYAIAVRQAEAAVEQAQAVADNARAEMVRREKLTNIAVTMEERQTYISQAAGAEAAYQSALANSSRGGSTSSAPECVPLSTAISPISLPSSATMPTSGRGRFRWSIPTRSGSTPISRRPRSAGFTKATRRRSS